MRIVIGFLLMLMAAPSYAKPLVTDLSEEQVAITAGFSGASLVLFGMKDKQDAELILKVQGPRGTEIIRKKARQAGLWLNKERAVFSDVPGYYDISSSAPLTTILDPKTLRQYGFGLDFLEYSPTRITSGSETRRLNEALIQQKQIQGLFALGTHDIQRLGPQLFRARIWIPPNVPIGTYSVTTYLIDEGAIIAQDSHNLEVVQAGVSGFITQAAHRHSLLYGLFAVFLAVFAGWASNGLFRKD